MKFGVVTFPGSNCDYDAFAVLRDALRQPVEFLWHQETGLSGCDCIILPGGFSYGDYLRTGAIARFSPIMEKVVAFANEGGLVLGICNGFQILTEVGLLPGALLRNAGLRFVCRDAFLRVERTDLPFTCACQPGQVLKVPVAHGDGNYFASSEILGQLERNKQIVFRYCEPDGSITPQANPNGSLANIAGLTNERGNVLGLMPHPERAAEAILGSADGVWIFRSLVQYLVQRQAA